MQMCIPLWLGSFGVIDILNEDILIVCIYTVNNKYIKFHKFSTFIIIHVSNICI